VKIQIIGLGYEVAPRAIPSAPGATFTESTGLSSLFWALRAMLPAPVRQTSAFYLVFSSNLCVQSKLVMILFLFFSYGKHNKC
jgi:hypothetical protein